LDLGAALNSIDTVPGGSTAASPIAVFDLSKGTTTVLNAGTSAWGTVAVWGTAAVWGSAAVWGTTVFVDGQAAVWGSTAVWGSAAVWGTAGTQANAAVWGTTAVWGTANPSGETLSLLINGEN
jgi:serine protease AprX